MSGIVLLSLFNNVWPVAQFSTAADFTAGVASGGVGEAAFVFSSLGAVDFSNEGSVQTITYPTRFLTPAADATAFEVSLNVTQLESINLNEVTLGGVNVGNLGQTPWYVLSVPVGIVLRNVTAGSTVRLGGTVQLRNRFTLQQITRAFFMEVSL